jgi:hypothetical protein
VKPFMRPFRSGPLLSRKQYVIRLGGFWMYTALWCALLWGLYYVKLIPIALKLVLYLGLVLVSPDIRSLFISYRQYQREHLRGPI